MNMQNILKIVCVVTLCVINQSASAMFCKLLGRCPQEMAEKKYEAMHQLPPKVEQQKVGLDEKSEQREQKSVADDIKKQLKKNKISQADMKDHLLMILYNSDNLQWSNALKKYQELGFDVQALDRVFMDARRKQIDAVLETGFRPSGAYAAQCSEDHLARLIEKTGYVPTCQDYLKLLRSEFPTVAERLRRHGASLGCLNMAEIVKNHQKSQLFFLAKYGNFEKDSHLYYELLSKYTIDGDTLVVFDALVNMGVPVPGDFLNKINKQSGQTTEIKKLKERAKEELGKMMDKIVEM